MGDFIEMLLYDDGIDDDDDDGAVASCSVICWDSAENWVPCLYLNGIENFVLKD